MMFAEAAYLQLIIQNRAPSPSISSSMQMEVSQLSRASSESFTQPTKKQRLRRGTTSLLEELLASPKETTATSGIYLLAIMLTRYPKDAPEKLTFLRRKIEKWFFSSDRVVSELGSISLSHFDLSTLDPDSILNHAISKLSNSNTNSFYFMDIVQILIKTDKLLPRKLMKLYETMLASTVITEQWSSAFAVLLERIKPWSSEQLRQVFKACWKVQSNSLDHVLQLMSPLYLQVPGLDKTIIPVKVEKLLFEWRLQKLESSLKLCIDKQVLAEFQRKHLPTGNAVTPNRVKVFRTVFMEVIKARLETADVDSADEYFRHVFHTLSVLQAFAADHGDTILNDAELVDAVDAYIAPIIGIFDQVTTETYYPLLSQASSVRHLFWPLSPQITKLFVKAVLQNANLSALNQRKSASRSGRINITEIATYGCIIDSKRTSKLCTVLSIIRKLLLPVGKCNSMEDEELKDLVLLTFTHILESANPSQLLILSEYADILKFMIEECKNFTDTAVISRILKAIFTLLEDYKTERNENLTRFCISFLSVLFSKGSATLKEEPDLLR
jgi:hypothetical protein